MLSIRSGSVVLLLLAATTKLVTAKYAYPVTTGLNEHYIIQGDGWNVTTEGLTTGAQVNEGGKNLGDNGFSALLFGMPESALCDDTKSWKGTNEQGGPASYKVWPAAAVADAKCSWTSNKILRIQFST